MVHEGDANSPDNGITGRNFAYRRDAWKLVFNSNEVPIGLYDLATDQFEKTNLLSKPEQSSRIAAMRSDFESALTSSRTAPPIGVPNYTLAPDSIAFGSQALNLDSGAEVVTLRITGGLALSISSIDLSGSNPSQFATSHNCASTLSPGDSCEISVKFRPTSVGSKTAFLTVVAGDGADTKRVTLSGTGVRSAMSVMPTSLLFGNQTRGTTSAVRTVTISNTGTIVLPIVSIKLQGSNPGQFEQSNNCPAQVRVGESCTVGIAFDPTSTGSKTAVLKITAGGGAAAKSVMLAGTGT